jgi:hypothetical protein
MNKTTLRQIVNIVAVIATIAINGLANALPLNGQTTGEISNRFDVYFVPAGYVFSIWGLIYIGLILFAGFQALSSQRGNPRLERIGYLFALSCAANILWLFLWHYEQFPLTLITMLCLLGLLIAIYLRLDVGRADITLSERWLVHIPISVYLGWISVATIANATTTLEFIGWDGWGIAPQLWAVIMLAVGTGLAALMRIYRRDVAFLLVIVWAFAGIAVAQAHAPLVANAAWTASGVVVLLLMSNIIRTRNGIKT